MHLIRTSLNILICFFVYFSAYPQNFSVKQYINKENLPSNIVFDMTIDPDGFILFATDNGVARFNGQKFSSANYFGKYKNKSILSLYNSSNKYILASSCDNKIIVAHPDSTVSYFSYNMQGKFCFNNIVKNNKKLYSYFYRYIYHINQTNNTFSIDKQRFVLPSGTRIRSLVSYQNQIIVCIKNNLYRYFDSREIELIPTEVNGSINAIYIYNNKLYLVIKNSIYRSSDLLSFEEIFNDKNGENIGKILITEDNELFYEIIGKGLYYQDFSEGKSIQLFECEQNFTFIKIDSNKTVWVGTYGNGIFSITRRIINVVPDPTNKMQMITSMAFNTYGKLLVGTDQGLMLYSNSMKELAPVREWDQYIWEINYSERLEKFLVSICKHEDKFRIRKSKKHNDINYIRSLSCAVSKDSIYTGAWDHYLNISAIGSNYITGIRFTEYPKIPKSTPYIKVNSVLIDDSLLYIGSSLGLYRVNVNTGKSKKIRNEKILQIKKGPDRTIWFVTPENIYNFQQGKIDTIYNEVHSDMAYNDLEIIPELDMIVIGTKSGLIFKTSEKEILINHLLGLQSQEITCIKYDHVRKLLWIGTTKGLHNIDIIKFNQFLNEIPKPYFILEEATILKDTTIEIEAGVSNFRLSYSLLALNKFTNAKFRYRINGSEWTYSDNQEIDLLVNNPGIYKLELSASNSGYIWSEPLSMTLNKKPFFWQSLFFKLFMTILIISVSIFLIRKRITVIRNRENEKRSYERQVIEYKFKAFASSINPHFVFNSLNSLQYLVNSREQSLANKYIKSFARLLRVNIDDLEKSFVSLQRELERVNDYLYVEKIRFGNRLSYNLQVDDDIDTHQIKIPGMILQPFVENSIKHGLRNIDNGIIDILVFRMDEFLKILIKDNGIVSKANQKKQNGKGNTLVNSRLQIIYNMPEHQFISTQKNDDMNKPGYVVEINIPLEHQKR